MLQPSTDLLGDSIKVTRKYNRKPITKEQLLVKFAVKQAKQVEEKRMEFVEQFMNSGNLPMFDDVLDVLRAPLLQVTIPTEYLSDCGQVPVMEDETQEAAEGQEIDPLIDYSPWGQPWVEHNYPSRGAEGRCGQLLGWSKDALLVLQAKLFWRSLEELGLSNNALEKWSALKWIFRPAIRREYVFDARIGKSHCLQWHERDETFSFHNCCIAARVEEDTIREGVRRNIPAQIIEAVERVVLA